ncbi:hypothetical protein KC19_2G168800 [Ceratodon purpureus]|uniref:RNB domain-containing protein n=1 Tax=Ceratodon purpureus TaxID=3225 RepID=A0A8T0IXM6_CERPU|nr:hypothetical protein KC19_2G168800 [Ceratodon purpureus]
MEVSWPCRNESFTKPINHATLGVSRCVEFTSPIRQYSDLLAHYQVKAVLRGELPPYSNAYVQAVMAVVNLLSTQAANLKYTLFRNRVPLPAATRNALPGIGASIFERTRACHSD